MDEQTQNVPQEPRSKANPWMISTLVLVGLVVGFGVGRIPLFTGNDGQTKTVNPPPPAEQPQISPEDYEKLSKALEDDDTVIGDPNAKVTVIEFSDFQCPFCGASAGVQNAVYDQLKSRDPSWEPIIPKLLATYVKEGKVKFIYRDFPLDFHPQAQETAEAAECADEQGKFLEMHDKIFAGYEEWGTDDEAAKKALKRYAKELNLNTGQFNDCFDSGKYRSEIQKDAQDGARAGVNGTPMFFVNGRQISGAQPFSKMASLIDSLL